MPRPQILDEFGKPIIRRQPAARVEAAMSGTENARHWQHVDSLSADAAFDTQTRGILRNRSRYEALNSGYLKSSVRQEADDVMGTGPRLQLTYLPDADGVHQEEAAREIERSIQEWMDEVEHPINLNVLEKSYNRDGGGFGIFDTDDSLSHPVKLYLRWVEDELCSSPWGMRPDPFMVDGIKFNRLGKPVQYWFLKFHPGGPTTFGQNGLGGNSHYAVNAEQVLHWFPKDRFGQHRGIPETTPALPLYNHNRRITNAVLTATEIAAMIAGVMKSALPEHDPLDPEHTVEAIPRFELIELVRGALLTLPAGWDAEQFKPEQPTANYTDFKRETLAEAGRALGQPKNIATGDSSPYNFSSGRLDHLPRQRSIKIRRNNFRLKIQDRVFREWVREARMVGIIPPEVADISKWRWSWNWDAFDSIDQNKDATADQTRLQTGTQTYAETYAAYGQDWQEQFEQLAREKAFAEKLGLPWPPWVTNAKPGEPEQGREAEQKEGEKLQEAVLMAMEECHVPSGLAAQVMDALAPDFARIRAQRLAMAGPQRNGKAPH